MSDQCNAASRCRNLLSLLVVLVVVVVVVVGRCGGVTDQWGIADLPLWKRGGVGVGGDGGGSNNGW